MTDQPAPPSIEVVSLKTESRLIVVPKANERQWVDAPEPGTYLDPFDGKLRRCRSHRSWWRNSPGGYR